MIFETAEQTAAKVYEVLKQAFPEIEFDVKTREELPHDSVIIRWIDGPMLWQVKEAVGFMESASADKSQPLGYTYQGQQYRGADYIIGERALSSERKQKVRKRLESMLQQVVKQVNSPKGWEQAELDLIGDGELMPTYRTVDESTPPVVDRRQELPANIVAFPVQEQELTAEQELKYFLMNLVADELHYVRSRLQRNGDAIDQLFLMIATNMYQKQGGVRS